MQVNSSPHPSTGTPPDRRRLVRYPCAAWVRAGSRLGVACDMNSLGVAFHTWDKFAENEVVELTLSFDAIDNPSVQVVHAARVVRVRQYGSALQVAVEFLD
jgi:hypothetical protein